MNNSKEQYWDGRKNFLARLYFYVMQGLAVINEFKYLVAFIFGIYLTLELRMPVILVLLFLISIPILGVLGYVKVYHLSKVLDWLSVELGTYWNRYTYELNEKQIELLKEIRDNLTKTNNDKLNS